MSTIRSNAKRQVGPEEALQPLVTGFSFSDNECCAIEMMDRQQDRDNCGLCDPASKRSKIRTRVSRVPQYKVFCQAPSLPPQFETTVNVENECIHFSTPTDTVVSSPACLYYKSGNEIDKNNPSGNTAVTDRAHACPHEVQFCVGQERQLCTASACELAAISPVFRVMFSGRWHKTAIELLDVAMDTFSFIIRHGNRENPQPQLTEKTVWEVLAVADRFQVLSAVHDCFHFLLHHHRHRNRSRHLCSVLETAHNLNYLREHRKCLELVKKKVAQIFRNTGALSDLCRTCMKQLVSADDLDFGVPAAETEIIVQEAVYTWAQCACANRGVTKPSIEQLRAEAGDMMYDVRYHVLSSSTRSKLLGDKKGKAAASLLLTREEADSLLQGDEVCFPKCINRHRGVRNASSSSTLNKMDRSCSSYLCDKLRTKACVRSTLQCVGLFVFLFTVIYVPVAILKNMSDEDIARSQTFLVKINVSVTTARPPTKSTTNIEIASLALLTNSSVSEDSYLRWNNTTADARSKNYTIIPATADNTFLQPENATFQP